jgi:hypothetical protein
MATHQTAQIRRLIQVLREPISYFSIYVELLDRERQTAGAQAYLKAMRANMNRAADVFDEIDFWLDHGYPRPVVQRAVAANSPILHDSAPESVARTR